MRRAASRATPTWATTSSPTRRCARRAPMGQRIKTISYPGRPNADRELLRRGQASAQTKRLRRRRTPLRVQARGRVRDPHLQPRHAVHRAELPDADSWENYQAGWRITGGQVVATTVTRADGSATTKRYNASGVDERAQDAVGRRWSSQRDAQGTASSDDRRARAKRALHLRCAGQRDPKHRCAGAGHRHQLRRALEQAHEHHALRRGRQPGNHPDGLQREHGQAHAQHQRAWPEHDLRLHAARAAREHHRCARQQD